MEQPSTKHTGNPLIYKQRRQLVNALRQSFSSPRQVVALLIVLVYGLASLCMILALVFFQPPEALREQIMRMVGVDDLNARLAALRGGLVLVLLLLSSTAIFQNPLLQFAPADIDLLFAAPVPVRRVLLSRMIPNHMRTFFAGYFFWGLAAVPALRLLGYDPLLFGAFPLIGLCVLFASIDQGFALLQIALMRLDLGSGRERATPASRWLVRAALLIFGLGALIVLAGLLARLLSGSWALLSAALGLISGPLASTLLLPLGLAGDLLLLPAAGDVRGALLALGALLLLDLATATALIRYVRRGGAGLLLETALSPQSSRLSELLERTGPNPLKIARELWGGEAERQIENEALSIEKFRRSSFTMFHSQFFIHSMRRLIEIRRTPVRSGLAVLVLGLLPLALYQPADGYSLQRLLTAIIFSTSLSTQVFNDVADHLRYGNLELSAPIARWRILLSAMLPRLLLYWLGGLVLLAGVGLLAEGARWGDLAMLALWYPLVLIPLLSLRAALVFLYPAAGIPGQKDPVQAVLVTLINGILVLVVITLSLLPFGVLIALISLLGGGAGLLWPVTLGSSALLSLACFGLMAWSYRRYEPAESGA
jgi:hypothetical protein